MLARWQMVAIRQKIQRKMARRTRFEAFDAVDFGDGGDDDVRERLAVFEGHVEDERR